MSRLWDTPDFWARTEADELLRDYPDTDVSALAASLRRDRTRYDCDPDFAREIIAELERRTENGIRFWPVPPELRAIENEVRFMMDDAGIGMIAADHKTEDEAPGFWWKRM